MKYQILETQKKRNSVLKKRQIVLILALLMAFILKIEYIVSSINQSISKKRVSNYIQSVNPRIPDDEREKLVGSILIESQRLNIPDEMEIDGQPINKIFFLTSFIRVESTFKRRCRSYADARGYMQLLPLTFLWINKKNGIRLPLEQIYKTETNIRAGVDYLNMLIADTKDARLVSLAYNAGPNNVAKGRYLEKYWKKILAAYRELYHDNSGRRIAMVSL
jgi:hypothetical protein